MIHLRSFASSLLPRLAATTSGQVDGLLPHEYAAAIVAA